MDNTPANVTPASTIVPSHEHSLHIGDKELESSSALSRPGSRGQDHEPKEENGADKKEFGGADKKELDGVAKEYYGGEEKTEPSHTGEHNDNTTSEPTGLKESEAVATPATTPEYPSGIKLVTISIALCMAVLLVALDNTIIATAIPRITDQFKSLDDVGWYASAYLLTTCSFQLLFGKFYSFFSIKWVFLTAIGIFELGSLICGVAPNSVALIVGRAVAGLGAAGLFSGALIIIAYSVPLEKRPIYTGMVGATYGVASVVGPLLGGVFTDRVTWRLCFLINLPVGAVTFVAIWIFFKSPAREKEASIGFSERFKQFDPIGTIVFIPAVVCLLLALQWGGTTYAWSNGRIIALFVLFGILIIVFVVVQIWKGETATVPPRIASQRSVAAAAVFGLFLGGSFFIFIYYLPVWFQAIGGVSATESGIRNLPLILSQVLGSIVAGVLITIIGYYTPFMYMSVILAAIGAGLLTTFTVDTGIGKWIGYQILYGFGTGLGFQQTILAAQTVLHIDDVPIGTSFVMFIQLLGGALFVSVGQNIFTNTLIDNLVSSLPNLDPAIVLGTGATNLRSIVSTTDLRTLLVAYNGALTKTFRIGLILSCLSVLGAAFVQWRSVKAKKAEDIAVVA